MGARQLRRPNPPSDLLVRVMAASINPVDTKTAKASSGHQAVPVPVDLGNDSPAWSPRPARMSDDSKSATRCSRASTKTGSGCSPERTPGLRSAGLPSRRTWSHTEAASIPQGGV